MEDVSEDMRSKHDSLEDDDFEPALAAPECQRCRTVYERSGKVPKLFQSKLIQKGQQPKARSREMLQAKLERLKSTVSQIFKPLLVVWGQQ